MVAKNNNRQPLFVSFEKNKIKKIISTTTRLLFFFIIVTIKQQLLAPAPSQEEATAPWY